MTTVKITVNIFIMNKKPFEFNFNNEKPIQTNDYQGDGDYNCFEPNKKSKTKTYAKVISICISIAFIIVITIWVYIENQKTKEIIKKISALTYEAFVESVYDNIKDSATFSQIDDNCSFFESAYRVNVTSKNSKTNFFILYESYGLYDATWSGVFRYNGENYILFQMNVLFYPNFQWAQKKIKRLI